MCPAQSARGTTCKARGRCSLIGRSEHKIKIYPSEGSKWIEDDKLLALSRKNELGCSHNDGAARHRMSLTTNKSSVWTEGPQLTRAPERYFSGHYFTSRPAITVVSQQVEVSDRVKAARALLLCGRGPGEHKPLPSSRQGLFLFFCHFYLFFLLLRKK